MPDSVPSERSQRELLKELLRFVCWKKLWSEFVTWDPKKYDLADVELALFMGWESGRPPATAPDLVDGRKK